MGVYGLKIRSTQKTGPRLAAALQYYFQLINTLYEQLAKLQNESYLESVERVEIPEGTVDERAYILEWLQNSEKSIFAAIKEQIDLNNKTWRIPDQPVKCEHCGHDAQLEIEMDQASFFAVS